MDLQKALIANKLLKASKKGVNKNPETGTAFES